MLTKPGQAGAAAGHWWPRWLGPGSGGGVGGPGGTRRDSRVREEFTTGNGDFVRENGDFIDGNCDFMVENGDLIRKKCDLIRKNSDSMGFHGIYYIP